MILSVFIESLVNKFMPSTGYVQSILELEPCSDADRPRASKESDENVQNSMPPKRLRLSENDEFFLPNLKPKVGTELQLTKFPSKNYPEGSSPSEITKHSLDSTFLLDSMLANYSE